MYALPTHSTQRRCNNSADRSQRVSRTGERCQFWPASCGVSLRSERATTQNSFSPEAHPLPATERIRGNVLSHENRPAAPPFRRGHRNVPPPNVHRVVGALLDASHVARAPKIV
ncbi:hypothetical protein MTO96_047368 [Rhipicephalus appendiculatus]